MSKDIRQSLEPTFRAAIKEALDHGSTKATEQDIQLMVELCMMAAASTGKEQPRDLLKLASDDLVEQMVKRIPTVKSNRLIAPICQFFVLEWCFRNSHLEEDWTWLWDSPNEGHVSYRSKIPLDQIPLPE
jgi:hypothetical protein